jgi:hypothetical protein
MNLFSLYIKFSENKNVKYFIYLFFLLFFLIGISIFRDYGISTDELFHRASGFYWYVSIVNELGVNNEYINLLKDKFMMMESSAHLASGKSIYYGVFFDLFSAFMEEIFKIKSSYDAYYFKHFLTFTFFFLSSIIFYKLIISRFKNKIFAIVLTSFFIMSPRIFAESFYNGKDIIFMSLSVISLYYALKYLEKQNINNIIIFSLFAALSTQIRIMGIFLFFLFLLVWCLQSLEEEKFFKKNFSHLIGLIFFYFLFLYCFWPYLWLSPFENFFKAFEIFSNYSWGSYVYYFGDYIKASNVPWHYIPVWIFITTPLVYLIIFFLGMIKTLIKFSISLLNITDNNNKKLWQNVNEKKDLFLLLYLLLPIFIIVLLNSTLYGGWRHLYFIYPGIIYFIAVGVEFLFNSKIKKIYKSFFIFFLLVGLTHNLSNLIKLHPYQNIYFNSVIEKRANKLFPIDYWGLANLEALKFIINLDKENLKTIRTASFTPLEFSKKLIKFDKENIQISGTEDLGQDYIFTNFYYERNPRYIEKYSIPKNYKKIFSIKRGNIIINEIYEKN